MRVVFMPPTGIYAFVNQPGTLKDLYLGWPTRRRERTRDKLFNPWRSDGLDKLSTITWQPELVFVGRLALEIGRVSEDIKIAAALELTADLESKATSLSTSLKKASCGGNYCVHTAESKARMESRSNTSGKMQYPSSRSCCRRTATVSSSSGASLNTNAAELHVLLLSPAAPCG